MWDYFSWHCIVNQKYCILSILFFWFLSHDLDIHEFSVLSKYIPGHILLPISLSWSSKKLLNITLVFFIFIFKPTFWLSLCNCKIIYYSLSVHLLIRTISSANIRLFRYSPLQVFENFLWNCHEIMSLCLIPFCIGILLLTWCCFPWHGWACYGASRRLLLQRNVTVMFLPTVEHVGKVLSTSLWSEMNVDGSLGLNWGVIFVPLI